MPRPLRVWSAWVAKVPSIQGCVGGGEAVRGQGAWTGPPPWAELPERGETAVQSWLLPPSCPASWVVSSLGLLVPELKFTEVMFTQPWPPPRVTVSWLCPLDRL